MRKIQARGPGPTFFPHGERSLRFRNAILSLHSDLWHCNSIEILSVLSEYEARMYLPLYSRSMWSFKGNFLELYATMSALVITLFSLVGRILESTIGGMKRILTYFCVIYS